VGVWFSPFGGYPCKKYRVESGRKLGFEITSRGLTLASPHYAARFYAACQGLVDLYGVNYFKFDGFGAGNNQPGALEFVSDVETLLDVIVRLRQAKPDVFVNPSTGSWPSPFWLLYADSIWRQGHYRDEGRLVGRISQHVYIGVQQRNAVVSPASGSSNRASPGRPCGVCCARRNAT